ncbi:MAG TPA: hypothetical protein VHD56_09340 [Tepidisphaeraceae bacterium]|nr:hypothetical protein [Tepidisphaeraceae bacterium]
MIRFSRVLLLMLLVAGCAENTRQPAVGSHSLSSETWAFAGEPGRTIHTEHYLIHTTISDEEFLQTLTNVMEGALTEYQHLTPGLPVSDRPMECYIFSRRAQWAQFTRDHTGADAAVYLQINRGGYTVHDWFVAYLIGDAGTYAVASHEGWHQYVARHFKSRLPPFLEEGIATMFENISWYTTRPQWNLDSNPSRADKLRQAIENHNLWPLEQLCTMHAGDVVTLSGERIETFYAQNWAFAQFMLNAEGGRYKPAMQRMLAELASGEADAFTGRRKVPADSWDPRTVKPLLEHYFDMTLPQIDQAYQAYIHHIASRARPSHFSS